MVEKKRKNFNFKTHTYDSEKMVSLALVIEGLKDLKMLQKQKNAKYPKENAKTAKKSSNGKNFKNATKGGK